MDDDSAPDYARLKETARAVKGSEEFAIDRIALETFQPILRGLTEARVAAAVAEVTGIPADILRSGARGGKVASARFLAGYVGKDSGASLLPRWPGTSDGRRPISCEASPNSSTSRPSARLSTPPNSTPWSSRLRSAKSGFRV